MKHEIRITQHDDLSHTVEHHLPPKRSKSGHALSYEEPESRSFSKGDHHEMLAHVANSLRLPEPENEDELEERDLKRGL